MKTDSPIPEGALDMVAHRFAVLGEPMRLRLLKVLFEGELSVGALAEATKGTQANVSRHLQTLTDAGLTARRKEGLQVFYSISDPSIYKLCNLVCGSLELQNAKRVNALARE